MINPDSASTYCANHPDRETVLRCNRCDKLICYQCAIRTPVGYRCRECVRSQQSTYYSAGTSDVLIGATIALSLGAAFGVLAFVTLTILRAVPAGGFLSILVAVLVGPGVGGLVAEVIRRAMRKRRARQMKWIAASLFVVGLLVAAMLLFGWQALLMRWVILLAGALAASTIYARLL